MSLFDLTGRVCVVTGSTKGIGRASAERMAEHGAQVVVTSRNGEDAEHRAREINDKFGANRALGLAFDLENRPTGKVLVDRTLDTFGRVDFLMCNAAHIVFGKLEELGDDMDALDASFQSNVRNYAALTRWVVPAMRAQGGGGIAYVLSTLGFFGSPPFLPYSVAKAALAHMTKILAVDYGPDNIRVNSIVPGSIRTSGNLQTDPEAPKLFVGKIPLQRQGVPDEMAGLAVLLASPSGAYATGQNFVIDGGQLQQGMEGARLGFEHVQARKAAEAKAAAEQGA